MDAKEREIQPLDATDARRFLGAAKGTRLEALYTVAFNLGLRRGELLGLRWSDVDLENSSLRATQAVQRVGGKLPAAETKTESSRRTLTLPASVVTALRSHRARQFQERLVAGRAWQDCGLGSRAESGPPSSRGTCIAIWCESSNRPSTARPLLGHYTRCAQTCWP